MKFYLTADLWYLIIGFIIFFAASIIERKKAKTKSPVTRDIFFAIIFVYLVVIFFIPVFEGDLTVDNEGNSYIAIENKFFVVGNKHKIMKFDDTGRLKWVNGYPFDASTLYKAKILTEDEDSNLYIGFERDSEDGRYVLKKNSDGKPAHSYLAKVDSNGKIIWDASSVARINAMQAAGGKLRLLGVSDSGDVAAETFGLEDGESGESLFVSVWLGYLNTVHIDEAGDFLCLDNIITSSLSKFSREGNPLWGVKLTQDAMIVVSDRENNVLVGGGTQRSAVIEKYNPTDGAVLWSTVFQPVESGASNYIMDIAADNSGNAYAVGYVRMSAATDGQMQKGNSFLAKISPTGELLWVKTDVFPKASNLFRYKQFDVDRSGNIYLTDGGSWFRGTSLTKLDTEGKEVWKAVTPGLKLMLTIMLLALAALNLIPVLKEKHQIRVKSRALK